MCPFVMLAKPQTQNLGTQAFRCPLNACGNSPNLSIHDRRPSAVRGHKWWNAKFEGREREWHGHPFVLWQRCQMWLCIYFTTLYSALSLSLKSRGISTWSQVLASCSAALPAEVVLPASSECRVSSFDVAPGKPTRERELGHFVCISVSLSL